MVTLNKRIFGDIIDDYSQQLRNCICTQNFITTSSSSYPGPPMRNGFGCIITMGKPNLGINALADLIVFKDGSKKRGLTLFKTWPTSSRPSWCFILFPRFFPYLGEWFLFPLIMSPSPNRLCPFMSPLFLLLLNYCPKEIMSFLTWKTTVISLPLFVNSMNSLCLRIPYRCLNL